MHNSFSIQYIHTVLFQVNLLPSLAVHSAFYIWLINSILVVFGNETFPHACEAAVSTLWYAPLWTLCVWVCVCVCTSVWGELCRSRGLDNWLVLECQMAEEGIMADSSCCHGGGGGGVKASSERGRRAFCEWAPRLSWPPSPNSGLPGAFVERGWEPRNLAASGWPSSTSL